MSITKLIIDRQTNQNFDENADGFTVGGGTTQRNLTVTGADITVTGSGTATHTFPNTSQTIVGTTATQTLTNKTIDGDSNTITDIALTSLHADVGFQVYRGTAQAVGTGWVLINFDTEEYDKGSDYNTTTYKFVAPVAGLYHFDWRVSWTAMGNQDYASALYKGGTRTKRGQFLPGAADAGGNSSSSGSVDIELAVNDEIQIYSYLQTAGRNIQPSSEICYFSGHLVAPS